MQTLTQQKGEPGPANVTLQAIHPPMQRPNLLADVVACHLGLVQSPAGGELAAQQTAARILQQGEGGEDSTQPVDTSCALGAAALTGEAVRPTDTDGNKSARSPSIPKRHGYRQDSPPEEIALLSEDQSGNTEAFAVLYRLHIGRVTRYVAYRMHSRNRDAVPDIVQEAFCNAFAGLDSAHHDVTGWL